MLTLRKWIYSGAAGVCLAFLCAGSAHAAFVNYTITGDVLSGDEFAANVFGLSAGDTITAFGFFDTDDLAAGTGTITFGGSNTLNIDVNGTLFSAGNDSLNDASLSFIGFALTDFDFSAQQGVNGAPRDFNSSFLFFDDFDQMIGEWRSTVETTPVPVPAAVWLFGSGLLGLMGIARRKLSA